jgi:hypothetical protein
MRATRVAQADWTAADWTAEFVLGSDGNTIVEFRDPSGRLASGAEASAAKMDELFKTGALTSGRGHAPKQRPLLPPRRPRNPRSRGHALPA